MATYTLTYNANSGTDAPVDPSSPYADGTTVTVLGRGAMYRDGYAFSKWNTAANGSGTDRNPAATFAMPGANTTLYAIWTAVTPGSAYPRGNSVARLLMQRRGGF